MCIPPWNASLSAGFTHLSIRSALRRAFRRVVLYLDPFFLFHHNFDVITIFFYYLNELLASFALGLPLPLPAYMTNAVDDACALRDCRSSAGLAQTVSRSLAPRWLGLLGAGRRISRLCAAAAAAVPPDSFLFIVVRSRSVEPSSLFSQI